MLPFHLCKNSPPCNRHYTDFKESGSCIVFQGLNCNRKLCKPQAIAITVSLNPFSQLRCLSLTIRQRFMPLMTCSTRTRTLEMIRLACFSVSLNSLPRGFFFGCKIAIFSSSNPWNPVSCINVLPSGRRYPVSSANFLS